MNSKNKQVFKNPEDAFNYSIQKIFELLLTTTMEFRIKPSSRRDSIKYDNTKFKTSKNLPINYWYRLSFINYREGENLNKLFNLQDELSSLGIYFDSGHNQVCRDWEFDWSFTYNPNSKK